MALQTLAEQALHSNLFLQTEVRDTAAQPPVAGSFDVIVVSFYLERPLFPALINALKPNGLIFYQTFTHKHFNDSGPGNPDFRLKNNELLQRLSDLTVITYHQNYLPWLDAPVDEACVVAKK